MNFRPYKNITVLNAEIRKYKNPPGWDSLTYSHVLDRIKLLIGQTPICAIQVPHTLAVEYGQEVPPNYCPLLTVFRTRRTKSDAWLQAVACFDICPHDLNTQWPDEKKDLAERLTASGIAYVVFPTTHMEDLAYLRSPDFKKRVRRAVFSSKITKFKDYPNLPVVVKRPRRR